MDENNRWISRSSYESLQLFMNKYPRARYQSIHRFKYSRLSLLGHDSDKYMENIRWNERARITLTTRRQTSLDTDFDAINSKMACNEIVEVKYKKQLL